MSEIPAIVGQNQPFLFNSHRILAAKNIAAAQNHAARPFPAFPKCIKTKRSGDVSSNAAIAQGKVTLLFDCSSIDCSSNILRSRFPVAPSVFYFGNPERLGVAGSRFLASLGMEARKARAKAKAGASATPQHDKFSGVM